MPNGPSRDRTILSCIALPAGLSDLALRAVVGLLEGSTRSYALKAARHSRSGRWIPLVAAFALAESVWGVHLSEVP